MKNAVVQKVGDRWTFSRSSSRNAHQTIGALVISGMMIVRFLYELNCLFDLRLDSELAAINREIEIRKEAHYELSRRKQAVSTKADL